MTARAARVFAARRVVTCDASRATAEDALGVIEEGAVVVEGDAIRWVGAAKSAPAADERIDAGELLTPGLVDAHTHAAWLGSRHVEYALRMAGGDYRAIAAAGGGIASTQRAIAAATCEQIAEALTARVKRMAQLGVTCVEVKSGYGLVEAEERKQLEAIARVALARDVPHVVPTFLALHALPAGVDRDAYVANVASTLVPEVAQRKLARFVDAYVDQNAFRVDEARTVAKAARARGLGVRMHVGQFADIGGAELCAEVGARSADHLEHVGDAGIAALAEARVAAGLLPTACFTLGQTPPPVAKLRAAGVAMVIASDANPGTAPTESLPLAMAMAVRLYGLTPAEAILGATRVAADSLDEGRRGRLTVGACADFVAWDLPHELALVQPWGTPRARVVVRGGETIYESR